MQTFLPYKDYKQTALCLDLKRLRNQVNEGIVILKTLTGIYEDEGRKGWPYHPATKMWANHERSLYEYIITCLETYRERTGLDNDVSKDLEKIEGRLNDNSNPPKWLGDERLHSSHRSNLLRKNGEYYSKMKWKEGPDKEYFWPTKNGY